jgi:hypothetical protein
MGDEIQQTETSLGEYDHNIDLVVLFEFDELVLHMV